MDLDDRLDLPAQGRQVPLVMEDEVAQGHPLVRRQVKGLPAGQLRLVPAAGGSAMRSPGAVTKTAAGRPTRTPRLEQKRHSATAQRSGESSATRRSSSAITVAGPVTRTVRKDVPIYSLTIPLTGSRTWRP